jgi:hypothetical protein
MQQILDEVVSDAGDAAAAGTVPGVGTFAYGACAAAVVANVKAC